MRSGELYQTFQLLTSDLRWIECAGNLTKNCTHLRLMRRFEEEDPLCYICVERHQPSKLFSKSVKAPMWSWVDSGAEEKYLLSEKGTSARRSIENGPGV